MPAAIVLFLHSPSRHTGSHRRDCRGWKTATFAVALELPGRSGVLSADRAWSYLSATFRKACRLSPRGRPFRLPVFARFSAFPAIRMQPRVTRHLSGCGASFARK